MSLCDFSPYWQFVAMCAVFFAGFALSSLASRSDSSNRSLQARRLDLERSFAEQRQVLLAEALKIESQKNELAAIVANAAAEAREECTQRAERLRKECDRLRDQLSTIGRRHATLQRRCEAAQQKARRLQKKANQPDLQ